jgi:hypothetical protein
MLKKTIMLFSVMASLTCGTSSGVADRYLPTCCTALKPIHFRAGPNQSASVWCVLFPGQQILLQDSMYSGQKWRGGTAYCPWVGLRPGWSAAYSNRDGRLLWCRSVGTEQQCRLF